MTENKIAASRRAFLFGLRADGSPTCHPMVALEKDGAPVFNTYRKSVKTRNFQDDPRAAAVLLDDWSTPPSAAQVVTGVMEEIEPIDPAAASATQAAEPTLHVPDSVKDRVQRRVDAGKRIFLRLRPGA